jgi:hypothetical protein
MDTAQDAEVDLGVALVIPYPTLLKASQLASVSHPKVFTPARKRKQPRTQPNLKSGTPLNRNLQLKNHPNKPTI